MLLLLLPLLRAVAALSQYLISVVFDRVQLTVRAPSGIEALESAFQDRYATLKRVYEQRLHGLVSQVSCRGWIRTRVTDVHRGTYCVQSTVPCCTARHR